MLFELSENISDDELKNIKFLLHGKIPRKKLQQDVVSVYKCKLTLIHSIV